MPDEVTCFHSTVIQNIKREMNVNNTCVSKLKYIVESSIIPKTGNQNLSQITCIPE